MRLPTIVCALLLTAAACGARPLENADGAVSPATDAAPAIDVSRLDAKRLLGPVHFDGDAVCALRSVETSVQVPAYADTVPLVIEVTYRTTGIIGGVPAGGGVAIGLGDIWHELPSWEKTTTERVCLGAAAYGRTLRVRAAPAEQPGPDCRDRNASRTVDIDAVRLVAAKPGECVAPGTVRGDGSALLLKMANACSGAVAKAQLSAPESGPDNKRGVALELRLRRGDPALEARLALQLDGKPWSSVEAGASYDKRRVCLPSWALGRVSELSLSIEQTGSNCLAVDKRSVLVDNLRLVDDAGCAGFADADFELARDPSYAPSWQFDVRARANASAILDANAAHAGQGVASLRLEGPCDDASAKRMVTIPSGDAPALRFYYRTSGTSNARFAVTLGGNPLSLAASNSWRQAQLYLSRTQAGRTRQLEITLGSGGGLCAATQLATLHLDDVELTSDASCL